MKICELSEYDKPYEKLKKYGLSALSDKELLAILIRSGTKKVSALEIAENILHYNDNNSLTNIRSMSLNELMSINGIGSIKCIQIKAIGELSQRLAKANYPERPKLNEANLVSNYMMEELRHLNYEELHLLSLDVKGRLIKKSRLFKGAIDSCTVSEREIFVEALTTKAVHIILVHNHPSGDPSPSNSDILLTKKISELGIRLGIVLWDHIIIGDNKFYSLKANNLF